MEGSKDREKKVNDMTPNETKNLRMSNLKCPICNNTLQIGITYHNGGMDESYKNWIVRCPSCNMFQIEYAADKFYGRESYTKEQVIACMLDKLSLI